MPRGSRGRCQASPVAVTVAPSRSGPVIRSVPRWLGGGTGRLAALTAVAAPWDARAGGPAASGSTDAARMTAVIPASRPDRVSEARRMTAPLFAADHDRGNLCHQLAHIDHDHGWGGWGGVMGPGEGSDGVGWVAGWSAGEGARKQVTVGLEQVVAHRDDLRRGQRGGRVRVEQRGLVDVVA